MAFLKQAKTEDEIKKLTVANVKKVYNTLAADYNKIINLDIVYCPQCGNFKSVSGFYTSNKTKSGIEHFACKSCVLDMATDYDKKSGIRTDNRKKTIEVFKQLDLPFIDNAYNSALDSVNEAVNENNRGTAFQQLLVMVKSLPQWSGLSFKDSEFSMDDEDNPDREIKENKKTIKNGKKHFGSGYTNEDYMFLENEYRDWISRYECSTKAQELIFKRLALNTYESDKARKAHKPTKDLDKTFQELLATGDITPRQNKVDSVSNNAQTLGTLIQKWEETRPLPDIDPELQDVDKIGLYIDVFFKGHTAKMLGIKNTLSHLYDKYIRQYTVNKPEYDDDSNSEVLFEHIFGTQDDD